MIKIIIVTALLNTTLIHIAKKWGWLDWYHTYRPKKWAPAANCYLCISFWMCIVEYTAYTARLMYYGHAPLTLWDCIRFVVICLCSASITNWFVNQNINSDHR